jgi:subtilase family serine protease
MWALEVSLDVEWAHAIAPEANILLVTTPTAETLGVQGFSQMMNAVQYVVDNHLADVISMSLGAGEGTFSGAASLMQLRQSLFDAQANYVTVLASSGDGGTSNRLKQAVKNPQLIPYPSVGWPASDPLVTAVGGTYLCTDATTGLAVDSASPPSACQSHPGIRKWAGLIQAGATVFSSLVLTFKTRCRRAAAISGLLWVRPGRTPICGASRMLPCRRAHARARWSI